MWHPVWRGVNKCLKKAKKTLKVNIKKVHKEAKSYKTTCEFAKTHIDKLQSFWENFLRIDEIKPDLF